MLAGSVFVVGFFFLEKGKKWPMVKILLKNQLTKRRTRSRCTRCCVRRQRGRQRNCNLGQREISEVAKEVSPTIKETWMCRTARTIRSKAVPECRGSSTAVSSAFLCAKRELSENGDGAR